VNEISAEDISQAYKTENQVLHTWMPLLADHLAELGAESVIAELFENSRQVEVQKHRYDWHYLLDGLKGIDRETLDSAIASLQEPLKKWLCHDNECQNLDEALMAAANKWHDRAENTKAQLMIWGKWAESAWPERYHKWRLGPFKISRNFSGAANLLESPQKLRDNWTLFQDKLSKIREEQRLTYISNKLTEEFNPVEFEEAIALLQKSQIKWQNAFEAAKQNHVRCNILQDEYWDQRRQLIGLLWKMPMASHKALMQIFRRQVSDPLVR
jgi:hypothetical protein